MNSMNDMKLKTRNRSLFSHWLPKEVFEKPTAILMNSINDFLAIFMGTCVAAM
jgi:hypothetical protein